MQGKRRKGSDQAVFYVSFIAGLTAGSFGALVVTPLDGMSPAFLCFLTLFIFLSIFILKIIFILVSLMP